MTLELKEMVGDNPIYLLKGVRSQIYIMPDSGRYRRFLAGYDAANDLEAFLERFFDLEVADLFDALAERYPQR